MQEWAGLTSDAPSVLWGEAREDLPELNDALGLTFDQIADVIEHSIPVDMERRLSPTTCGYCGHVGGCRTTSGRKAERHNASVVADSVWSAAHTALDLGDIDVAVSNLIVLDRINEGITS